MTTFRVSGQVTISIFADVEAETEEEAMEKAYELSMPSLCHGCSSAHGHGDVWGVTEFDGEASHLRVDES
jgi:hypothetical protein